MNKTLIECSYCRTKSSLLFISKDYNRKISNEKFHHYRCPGCGLIFVSPIPKNLGDYYPNSYHYIPDTIDFLDDASSHEAYKIEIIRKFIQSGKLLEIGPSLGAFSYLAKKTGFDSCAIEMDSRCSDFLNNVAGIPTVNSNNIITALDDLQSFDIIAMWHVIEHLPNPWEALEAISMKIKHNGILVMAAPNPDAYQFGIMGRFWPHVDAPRHVMLIPLDVLIEKMEKLGMSVVLNTTTDEGGLGWNVFGWEYFLSNMSNNQWAKKILAKCGRKLSRLFEQKDGAEGKGSAYTVVFRKGV